MPPPTRVRRGLLVAGICRSSPTPSRAGVDLRLTNRPSIAASRPVVKRKAPACRRFAMELAGLEPATFWVRFGEGSKTAAPDQVVVVAGTELVAFRRSAWVEMPRDRDSLLLWKKWCGPRPPRQMPFFGSTSARQAC